MSEINPSFKLKGKRVIEKNKGIDDYFLMADLINNLIIDRSKKIPLQLVDKEEERWVDINTNGEDDIAIEYNNVPWRVLLVLVIAMLQIIFDKIMRES